MRKINEIFYSLQGEGRFAGCPSLFIRFSGCNLCCPFCDTRHQEGVYMEDDAIVHAANMYKAPRIVLTGGEPSLWIDEDFIRLLRRATGKSISIETNGTRPLPPGIDWVTLSPKEGICGDDSLGKVAIDRADEIKVVDTGQDLEQYFRLPCRSEDTLMYLQPCFTADPAQCEANRMRTVRRVLDDPRWTLSLQIHRFLNIP